MAGKSGFPPFSLSDTGTVTFCMRQIKESIPSLAELGGHQLYPLILQWVRLEPPRGEPNSSALTIILQDRRPALLAILRSMLVTYSSLLGSLLEPPTRRPRPISSPNGRDTSNGSRFSARTLWQPPTTSGQCRHVASLRLSVNEIQTCRLTPF
jgi:hypothetical protein